VTESKVDVIVTRARLACRPLTQDTGPHYTAMQLLMTAPWPHADRMALTTCCPGGVPVVSVPSGGFKLSSQQPQPAGHCHGAKHS
jgi:hypothetical protein